MSLLTDEEIDALWLPDGISNPQVVVRRAIARAVESAVLAKLAGAELPEPLQRDDTDHGVDYFTADQLRRAYAQGAAAQLAQEPILNIREQDREIIHAGTRLYIRRQAND